MTRKWLKGQIQTLGQELRLTAAEMNHLYNEFRSQYLYLVRRYHFKKDATDEDKNQKLYMSIRANVMEDSLIKDTNKFMYQVEYRQKHDYVYGIGGLIDAARSHAVQYSPFFLASSHPKPAKDHAQWEGKVYYDENFERYAASDDLDRIRAYIRNHKLLTIQYIVGAPVYLLTRRNCKHFFRNIPLEEIMHSSAKSLLKKHNMYHEDKDVPASEDVLRYRMYKERLQCLEQLNQQIPNKLLKSDLKKVKIILDKYKEML